MSVSNALVQPDRWTCPDPDCHKTVVVPAGASDDAARAKIRRAQKEHGIRHERERRPETAKARAR